MSGVDPRLIEILTLARARTGIPFEISEGFRDRDRQAELVASGKSQTMNSRHMHGNALDIHILNPDGAANWDFEAYRPIAEAAKAAALELGYEDFVWGGDWESLKDGVHFQIGGNQAHTPTDSPTQPANALYQAQPPEEQQNALLALPFNGLNAADFMVSTNALASHGFDRDSNPYMRFLS